MDAAIGSDSADGLSATVGGGHGPWLHSPNDAAWAGGASPLLNGDTVKYARDQIHYGLGITLSTTKTVTYDASGTGAAPIYRACPDPSTLVWTGSGSEYYTPIAATPGYVYDGDTELTSGTVGALSAGQWGWDNTNKRVYVRLVGDVNPAGEAILIPTANNTILSGGSSVPQTISNITFELGKAGPGAAYFYNSTHTITLTNTTHKKAGGSGLYLYKLTAPVVTNVTIIARNTAAPRAALGITGTTTSAMITNPTIDCSLSVANYCYGIQLDTSSATVSGGTVANATYGIYFSNSVPNATISGMTISGGNAGIRLDSATNVTISNNTVQDCAVEFYIASNGNTISNNTITLTSPTRNSIGVQLQSANNNIISGNTITNMWNGNEYGFSGYGIGVFLGPTSQGNTITNNTIDGAYEAVILQETSGAGGNLIAYNIIKNSHVNDVEIFTKGTSATDKVYNNVIDHNPTGSAGHAIVFRGISPGPLTYADVRNNLIIQRTAIGEMIMWDANAGTSWTITLDYNTYIQVNAAASWWYIGQSTTNFNTWKTILVGTNVIGGDSHSSTTSITSVDSDYKTLSLSPTIDAATASVLTSTTTDYLGLPIYGTPDIGAYEYQPPFTIGTDKLDTTGNIRIYGDRQYRYTTATSSTMSANLTATPAETWGYDASTTRPEWLNISSITWGATKQWTASSSNATTTIFTVGDLTPNMPYTVTRDSATTTTITGTNCVNGVCTANDTGFITFTYDGGYSTHIFTLTPDTTIPTVTLTAPTNLATVSGAVTLTANATDDIGVTGVQFTLNGANYGPELTTAPYTTTWNTATLVDDNYTLAATVRDASNHYATSTITVTVKNTADRHQAITSVSEQTRNRLLMEKPAVITIPTEQDTLLAKITELRAQIAALQTGNLDSRLRGNDTGTRSIILTRSWSFGQSGTEVKQLQQFLNTHGWLVAKTGAGSPGHETTFFGYATRAAVIKFQRANHIEPIGVVGPRTRSKIQKILGQ